MIIRISVNHFVHFFLEYLKEKLKLAIGLSDELRLVRAYAYDGEYAVSLLKKIEKTIENETKDGKTERVDELKNLLAEVRTNREKQLKKHAAWTYLNFFQLECLPLKYDPYRNKIFQKGVDVQLAVDLVSNAYDDNYDIALICSGDADLQKSVEKIKSLGKQVIVACNKHSISDSLRKHSDFCIFFEDLKEEDLKKFTREMELEESKGSKLVHANDHVHQKR